MRHLCMRTAHGIYRGCRGEKLARPNSMICRVMKSHSNEHTVQGRPTLKDVKRFRNGSLKALREINLRANILSEFIKNHVIPKGAINRGYQLFSLIKASSKASLYDREPSRIPARTQELLSNKSRKVREFVYECICSSTPK